MENTLSKKNVFAKLYTNEIFSVIPGIDKAKRVTEVDSKDLTEIEFCKNWVEKNKPCLVRNAVKHWPAYRKWREEEYWYSTIEDFEIHMNPNRNFNSRERQVKDTMIISFHEAVKLLFRKEDRILSIPAEVIGDGTSFRNLAGDMAPFPFLPNPGKPRGFPHARIFLHKKASTGWHYHDVDETLMCQVKGDKAVALLPPRLPKIRQVESFLTGEQYLTGKTLDPNLDLSPFIVQVKEGDALYIPPYWFHAVVPTDDAVGATVAYCWKSPVHKFGDLSSYLVRKLYLQVLWPIGFYTFLMPFMGVYSIFRYLLYRSFFKLNK
jgi:hypothetical protein